MDKLWIILVRAMKLKWRLETSQPITVYIMKNTIPLHTTDVEIIISSCDHISYQSFSRLTDRHNIMQKFPNGTGLRWVSNDVVDSDLQIFNDVKLIIRISHVN